MLDEQFVSSNYFIPWKYVSISSGSIYKQYIECIICVSFGVII